MNIILMHSPLPKIKRKCTNYLVRDSRGSTLNVIRSLSFFFMYVIENPKILFLRLSQQNEMYRKKKKEGRRSRVYPTKVSLAHQTSKGPSGSWPIKSKNTGLLTECLISNLIINITELIIQQDFVFGFGVPLWQNIILKKLSLSDCLNHD